MKKSLKILKLLSWFLMILLIWQQPLYSQNQTGISFGSAYLQPVSSLQSWFKGTFNAPQLGFIFNRTSNTYWQFLATVVHFNQPNTKKLFYKDLKLDLKLYGAGVSYSSFLTSQHWRLQPFWTAGVTLFRWQALRAAYQLEDRLVPERFQQAWGFAPTAGVGGLFHFSKNVKLSICGQYQLVVAELWPALALHLENVSGLQMVTVNVQLHWWF